jgi:electron transport complex protein RnfB
MQYCSLVDTFVMPTLTLQIDALLPQTQCTQCGFQGCMPYAEAIATGEAEINRCPPGGDAGIAALASLLARAPLPLDTSRGLHYPHRIAVIDSAACIGCAKCLAPCPTDAIIGASKFMHTVVASLCTGCELCILPCPVDCIRMEENPHYPVMMDKNVARARHTVHVFRLRRDQNERVARLVERECTVSDISGGGL